MMEKCFHCRREFAMGEFRLTKKVTGRVKDAKWSVEYNSFVIEMVKPLCAQCGFNIVNYRVAKHVELPEETTHAGKKFWRIRTIFLQDRPYVSCVFLKVIKETMDVATEESRLRYYEAVQAIEKQKHERRLNNLAFRLRQMGKDASEIDEILASIPLGGPYTPRAVAAPKVEVVAAKPSTRRKSPVTPETPAIPEVSAPTTRVSPRRRA